VLPKMIIQKAQTITSLKTMCQSFLGSSWEIHLSPYPIMHFLCQCTKAIEKKA